MCCKSKCALIIRKLVLLLFVKLDSLESDSNSAVWDRGNAHLAEKRKVSIINISHDSMWSSARTEYLLKKSLWYFFLTASFGARLSCLLSSGIPLNQSAWRRTTALFTWNQISLEKSDRKMEECLLSSASNKFHAC